jgi:hypothetical protein
VKLASRGQRDWDTGPEVITQAAELAAVRRQARAVHLKALVTAGILTLLLFLV